MISDNKYRNMNNKNISISNYSKKSNVNVESKDMVNSKNSWEG